MFLVVKMDFGSVEKYWGLKQKHKKQPFSDASASHLSLVLWQSDFKQMLESATPQHQRRPPQWGRWHRQKDKNRSPSAKNPAGTWYFTSAHNCDTILNINHLERTRSIASLPCKIVLGDWYNLFSRIHFIFRGFSPWNGERFLSLGQCGEPSWEGGVRIVWLAEWKLVSNDAKRTIPTPNAKHSTVLQGCFLCFCLWIHWRFGNNEESFPWNFPLSPINPKSIYRKASTIASTL